MKDSGEWNFHLFTIGRARGGGASGPGFAVGWIRSSWKWRKKRQVKARDSTRIFIYGMGQNLQNFLRRSLSGPPAPFKTTYQISKKKSDILKIVKKITSQKIEELKCFRKNVFLGFFHLKIFQRGGGGVVFGPDAGTSCLCMLFTIRNNIGDICLRLENASKKYRLNCK